MHEYGVLKLSNCPCMNEDLADLKELNGLCELDLSGTRISDDAVATLGE